MSTFTTGKKFANVQIAINGRAYAFEDGVLEVEDEADAKRVRVFGIENPHLNIREGGESVEPKEETPVGEDNEDEGDAPDPDAGAVEGAEAPEPADTDTDAPAEVGEAPDAADATDSEAADNGEPE